MADNPRSRSVRVLFVYPPVRLQSPARVPPMGFLYLGALLEQAGHHVEILDLNARRMVIDEAIAEIATRQFDVIGIGGMTTTYYYIKLLTRLLKERYPNVPIIGGGSACSASPEIVLANTGVDVVCVGEGEPIIDELVRRLANRESVADIEGIAFRAADDRITKTKPRSRFEGWPEGLFPAHHLVDMDLYIRNNALKYATTPGLARVVEDRGHDPDRACRPVHIFSKRGCPFGCTFCYRNFGRKVVYDSTDHSVGSHEVWTPRS